MTVGRLVLFPVALCRINYAALARIDKLKISNNTPSYMCINELNNWYTSFTLIGIEGYKNLNEGSVSEELHDRLRNKVS